MMATKYKDNFTEKVTIEIPNELVWNGRKYKVVNQNIEVENCCGHCIIRNHITLKMPMFYFNAGSRQQDIKEMCISMSNQETKAETYGWEDSELKTYGIMITQSLESPFVSNIMKKLNNLPVKGG